MTDYDEKSVVNDDPSYLEEEEIRALFDSMLLRLTSPIYVAAGGISGTGDDPWELTPEEMNIKLGDSSEIGIQDWGNTMTFSATDADTVEWSVGDITLTSGKIYNIDDGNTGTMSAITYIYLDVGTSETALQTSTTAADSVGSGKILVAVAEDNAGSDATLQVFGGSGGILIKADNIAADTITVNEIAANTITATEMNVATLSSIAANIGTITSGTVTGATIQTAAEDYRIKMSSNNKIQFLNDDTERGSMTVSAAGDVIINAVDDVDFAIGGTTKCYVGSSAFVPSTDNAYDLGSTSKAWKKIWCEDIDVNDDIIMGGTLSGSGNINITGTIYSGGKIRCGDTFEASDGTDGIDSSSKNFVTTIRYDDGAIEYRTRSYTHKDGLMTNVGSESDWERT